MKKSLLLFAIICCILVLVPSCRKKGDGSENTSLVQSLISSESTSNLEPVVVVPQPQSAEKRAQDSEKAVAAPGEETKTETAEEKTAAAPEAGPAPAETEAAPVDTTEVEVETETTPAVTEETEVEEKTEVADETAAEEEETPEAEVYYSFPYSYNGYSSYLEIADTYTTLTVPEGVSDEDIAAVAAMISETYPAESSLITYRIAGGTLTLYYPRQTRDYIDSIVPFVEAEAMTLLDMYPVASGEETVVEESHETTEEKTPVSEVKTEETAPLEAPAVTVMEEKAVSEKGAFIKNCAIAAYAEPKFNLTGGWSSPFAAGFGVRAEASFNDKLALGLRVQYDLSAYIESSLYLKWTFAELDKAGFYLRGGAGATFGVSANRGQKAFLFDAALGMDYNFTSSLSLFAEITGEWSIPKPGLEFGASVGVKYTF